MEGRKVKVRILPSVRRGKVFSVGTVISVGVVISVLSRQIKEYVDESLG